MKRRKFLVQAAAPVLVLCASCSKSGNNPQKDAIDFSIDLTSNLLTVGASMVRSGVIIVRINTGNLIASFIAFQVECTHAANPIVWNQAQQQFNCNLHGSVFSSNGSVVNGPANRPLQSYTLQLNGTELRVTG